MFQTSLSARNMHVTRSAMGEFDAKVSSVRKQDQYGASILSGFRGRGGI